MSWQIIDVDPSHIAIPSEIAAQPSNFVYEHLKRYCEKFSPLPAITVAVQSGRLIAINRIEYLLIARELGINSIRAVVNDTPYDLLVSQGVPGVLGFVPPDVLNQDDDEIVIAWHVFYFQLTPTIEMAQKIEGAFLDFLNRSLPPILGTHTPLSIKAQFDLSAPCLELNFPTPVTNIAWMNLYRAFIISVDQELIAIASYQGRPFAR